MNAHRLPDHIDLNDEEKRWVGLKWTKIRSSQARADAASNRWNRINDHINAQIAATDQQRRGVGMEPLTDLTKAGMKGDSLPLRDAFDEHKWHAAEAQRHIDDLSLFVKLKELGWL
jgi:hypothetical protein